MKIAKNYKHHFRTNPKQNSPGKNVHDQSHAGNWRYHTFDVFSRHDGGDEHVTRLIMRGEDVNFIIYQIYLSKVQQAQPLSCE